MRTRGPAVGQTYKMQLHVAKGKGLSSNQIPGHTCYPSMSVTLPDSGSEWPVKIMIFTSLPGKDLVHNPNSIFKVTSHKKAQKYIWFLIASTIICALTHIVSLTHFQPNDTQPAWSEWGLAARRPPCLLTQLILAHIPVSFLLPFPPSRLFFSTAFNIFSSFFASKEKGRGGRRN